MFDKYNRSEFLDTQNVDGIVEKDLVMYNWELFNLKLSAKKIILTAIHLHRPESLSKYYYGTEEYWWIISKLNNIDDWWNDTYVGQEIYLPDIKDIDNFYVSTLNKRM